MVFFKLYDHDFQLLSHVYESELREPIHVEFKKHGEKYKGTIVKYDRDTYGIDFTVIKQGSKSRIYRVLTLDDLKEFIEYATNIIVQKE